MIITSIVFSLFIGNADKIIEYITNASSNAIENVIILSGMLCFWTGIFNVIKHTRMINILSRIVHPVINKLFKEEETNENINQNVALNIVSNAIGAGNAATVFGINATKEMQELNKEKSKPNDSMASFMLLNTASIQIIPTTIISLRIMFESNNPGCIILPVWIVSVGALIAGIISLKIFNKVMK